MKKSLENSSIKCGAFMIHYFCYHKKRDEFNCIKERFERYKRKIDKSDSIFLRLKFYDAYCGVQDMFNSESDRKAVECISELQPILTNKEYNQCINLAKLLSICTYLKDDSQSTEMYNILKSIDDDDNYNELKDALDECFDVSKNYIHDAIDDFQANSYVDRYMIKLLEMLEKLEKEYVGEFEFDKSILDRIQYVNQKKPCQSLETSKISEVDEEKEDDEMSVEENEEKESDNEMSVEESDDEEKEGDDEGDDEEESSNEEKESSDEEKESSDESNKEESNEEESNDEKSNEEESNEESNEEKESNEESNEEDSNNEESNEDESNEDESNNEDSNEESNESDKSSESNNTPVKPKSRRRLNEKHSSAAEEEDFDEPDKKGKKKRDRVVWSEEEHKQFVNALQHEKKSKRIMWAEFAKKYNFQKTPVQCRNHYQAMIKKYRNNRSKKE